MTTQQPTPRRRTLSQRFEKALRRGVSRRGAFPFLVVAIVGLALSGGVLARLLDPDEFASFGDATWWSLVTLTTVGYGDIVPKSFVGRAIGVAIMALGVTFISFLTATVTSLFVSTEESSREDYRIEREAEVRATLQRIENRLSAIEARLERQ